MIVIVVQFEQYLIGEKVGPLQFPMLETVIKHAALIVRYTREYFHSSYTLT